MTAALKTELRKLLSVRSTYIVTALVLLLVIIISGYGAGWRLSGRELSDPTQFLSDIFGALNLVVFGAVIAVLLVTHEYRYNTIMYSLTISNSRGKVLLAKAVTISIYALVLTVLLAILSPLAAYAGVHLAGNVLAPQTIHFGDVIWRSLFFGWAYGMAGLLLATLIRSQVGAIAALFLVPGVVEQLLAELFGNNAVYLPFTALRQLLNTAPASAAGTLTPAKGAFVFGIYLVVGWVIAWFLFLRRDAN